MPDSHRPTPPLAPQPDDWLALDRQLCFALYASSLAMTKLYRPLLEPLGLTYPQYLVLLALWDAAARAPAGEPAGLHVAGLGDRLSLDSGTLTPLLKRLEAQGLVQRQRDPEDERRLRVQLTPSGHALKARAVSVPQAIACATACDLDEIVQLTHRLRELRGRLQRAIPA